MLPLHEGYSTGTGQIQKGAFLGMPPPKQNLAGVKGPREHSGRQNNWIFHLTKFYFIPFFHSETNTQLGAAIILLNVFINLFQYFLSQENNEIEAHRLCRNKGNNRAPSINQAFIERTVAVAAIRPRPSRRLRHLRDFGGAFRSNVRRCQTQARFPMLQK